MLRKIEWRVGDLIVHRRSVNAITNSLICAILPLKEIAMKRNPIAKALANSNLKPQIIPNKKAYKRKPKHIKQNDASVNAVLYWDFV